MPSRNIVIVGLAVLLGLVAVWLGNSFFTGVEKREAAVAEQNKLARIVVASQDLAFGTPLSTQNVRLINWPQSSVPTGAFTTITDVTKNRVALRPMVAGEPVLASKVSGSDGRASLAANLPPGQVAYTILISDVAGVGGFARPGDVVDVLLTRNMPGESAGPTEKMNDVVLHAVPLLGVDLISDQSKSQPAVGKTATLQVNPTDAQKLALASQIGVLSLALRNVADKTEMVATTVIPRDLSANRVLASRPAFAMASAPAGRSPAARAMIGAGAAMRPRYARPQGTRQASAEKRPVVPASTMTIFRGTTPTDYEVRHGR